MRRKVVKRTGGASAQDDKKLQAALKKINVTPVTGIEEVNMFREDGNVLHFTAPKGMSLQSALPMTLGLFPLPFSLSTSSYAMRKFSTSVNRPCSSSARSILGFLRVIPLPSSPYPTMLTPSTSTRQPPSEYNRHLWRRLRQGAYRACPRHPQPARPRLARFSPQAC